MTDEHKYWPEPEPRRRAPAGQALVTILVAFLLAALLNADRLDYTARTQPFGWQRTWAMKVTGLLQSTSHALFLDRPRHLLADKAGNLDPPPPESTGDVEIVRPGSSPGSGSGADGGGVTTTTRPPEFRLPSDDEPVRILVAGDSLMGFIGPALVQELDGYPIEVIEDWNVGTGLARPDVLNWPAQLGADMAQHDPEVVILGFGGNDMQHMASDDGLVEAGTEEWKLEYQRRVVQVLEAVEAPNRTVYWIGLPITTRSDIERIAPVQAEAVKAEIAVRPWAHFVDTRPLLSPGGEYVTYLPDEDGNDVKVREGDGVHPNLAGARRMISTTAEALITERKLAQAVAAATTTTTTTTTTVAEPGTPPTTAGSSPPAPGD